MFMRLERLRSMVPLTGEADSGERCKPALIVAAACSEDKEGERGEGGPGGVTMASVPAKEMRRDPLASGEPEVDVRELWGRVLMSGDIGMIGRWLMVVGWSCVGEKARRDVGEWRTDKEI